MGFGYGGNTELAIAKIAASGRVMKKTFVLLVVMFWAECNVERGLCLVGAVRGKRRYR